MIKIAMTGTSGSMGSEALRQTLELNTAERVRILLTPKKKNDKLAAKLKRRYGARIEIVRGRISDENICRRLVEGADIVVNMAAVIPPHSDNDPRASYECNLRGAIALADAVAAQACQPKLVHISTVAVYGSRTLAHPWGRPGDPILPAVFDSYALHKALAERYIMERGLQNWVILRQTAILYDKIVFNNIRDGLLFHTTLNGPLEWITARDSGYLIRRIAEREAEGENAGFWNRVFDVAGGAQNRRTGYDTFAAGFSIMGGSPRAYFTPNDSATRNFHGLWFADADELDTMFGYRRDTVDGFWRELGRKYRIFRLARIVPAALIRRFLFRRLLNDKNSPMRWLKDGDEARVIAAFGSAEAARALPQRWEDYPLADAKAHGAEAAEPLTDCAGSMLRHGYDENKPPEAWTIEDMRQAAKFRGGKCLSEKMGATPYDKLVWQCCEGHTFEAAPYTVLIGGHWCPDCMPQPWEFDRLAKKMPYFAQVWYDSHSSGENMRYSLDEDGTAHAERGGEER